MTRLNDLTAYGQSVWLDYIRRFFLTSGDLQKVVDQGVRGVTSNPSIFEKAIAGSADYDEELQTLVHAGKSVEEIYQTLILDDIQRTADVLRPVFDQTGGADGFVSLEVSPTLANNTEGTVAEARRLFAAVNRPNVMIKVPATPAGVPAIQALIGEGINVNVTLIFSLAQYEPVAQAYLAGLERLAKAGGNLHQVASAASFFVSRVDTAVDVLLEPLGETELQGKIAIANAKVGFARFREIFDGARWEALAIRGARVQRPLWASTGTKNHLYSDTLYVDALIGPDTINTVPLATLQAFLDHGQVAPTLETGVDEARQSLARLADLGVDLDAVTQRLQDEGVAAFAKSFVALMASIGEKREKLLAGWQHFTASLGSSQEAVDKALAEMAEQQTVARLWAHDFTVWKPEPTEIVNRLGWLHSPEVMEENLTRLQPLADGACSAGYTQALLLGMGGSSLAPEVLRKTFGVKAGYLDLTVLDSTDPDAVLSHARHLDLARSLFIVSSKSGGTVEVLSFFKFFFNRVVEAVGADKAGEHFVGITDPGSTLADLGRTHKFRDILLNDPNIGGRYSALSYFGLVPAALIGLDLPKLLARALKMVHNCESCNHVVDGDNNGARLGAVMGALAKEGRDKITLISSPAIASFGDWVEQLIAESTGKEGKGILPVVGESIGSLGAYGDDRLFVYLRLEGDETYDAAVQGLEEAGQRVVRLRLDDVYDLGGQFFLWEMATALAGGIIDINPFDQPNVEAAKILARQMVAGYFASGRLPEGETAPLTAESFRSFLGQAKPGDYVALQAYVQPTAETDAALLTLRTRLRDSLKIATTVGYGPRFLHSTGQLHKGDRGNGLFVQFVSESAQDVAIPDEAGSATSSMTFGVLKAAQALGDAQALRNAGRRLISFHLGPDVVADLERLTEALG